MVIIVYQKESKRINLSLTKRLPTCYSLQRLAMKPLFTESKFTEIKFSKIADRQLLTYLPMIFA